MMLLSINFTVIPFLLEALMFVEDMQKWNFGPAYIFQLNKTTKVYMDMELEIYVTEKVIATVSCQPNSSQSVQNVLFCHAKEISVHTNMTQQMYEKCQDISNLILERYFRSNDTDYRKSITFDEESTKIPDQLFKIEFDRQGVRSFEVKARENKARENKTHHYDIVRDVVDQFNIGIDLSIAIVDSMRTFRGSYVIMTLKQYEEHTTRASNCNMSGVIIYPTDTSNQYNENGEFDVQENDTKFDAQEGDMKFGFQFKLLPIFNGNDSSKSFWITRIRSACIHRPENLTLFNKKWKIHNMIQYFSEMKIHNKKPKFTSHTHLEGDAFFPKSLFRYYFLEDVHLHLLRIEAARNELNAAKYE